MHPVQNATKNFKTALFVDRLRISDDTVNDDTVNEP